MAEIPWSIRTREDGVRSPYADELTFILKIAPQNVQWSQVGNDVVLTWDPPLTARPIDGYAVRRDGAIIGTTLSTTFVDEEVPEGTYEYEVVGFAELEYLVIGNTTPTIAGIIVEVASKQDVSNEWPLLPPGDLRGVAGWSGGKWLAFVYLQGGDGRRLWVMDRDTGDWDTSWPAFPSHEFRSAAFSSDGQYLILGQAATDGLIVLDVDTKLVDSGWPAMSHVSGLFVDGDRCFISASETTVPRIRVLDIPTKLLETGWPSELGLSRGVSWVAPGTRLLVPLWESPKYDVLDVVSKAWETGWPKPATRDVWSGLAVPSRGKIFIGLDGSPRREVIDIASKTVDSGWPTLPNDAWSFTSINNGRFVVVGVASNSFQVWDLDTKTVETGWSSFNNVWRSFIFRGAI